MEGSVSIGLVVAFNAFYMHWVSPEYPSVYSWSLSWWSKLNPLAAVLVSLLVRLVFVLAPNVCVEQLSEALEALPLGTKRCT